MKKTQVMRKVIVGEKWLIGTALFICASILTAPAKAAVSPDPAQISYSSGNSYLPTPASTMYVLKGTTVTFKAQSSLQMSGQPTLLEKNWDVDGGGVSLLSTTPNHTYQVRFDEVSENTIDLKTITVKSDMALDPGQTISFIVYDLTAVMTPFDDFVGRSQLDVGVGETGTFTYTTTPLNQFGFPIDASLLGGLTWSKEQGDFDVNDAFDGTGTWIAGTTNGVIKAALKLQHGPSKGTQKNTQRNVVRPTSLQFVTVPVTVPNPNIYHVNNTVSAGFNLGVFLLPGNVTYGGVTIQEGCAAPVITGTWLPTKSAYTEFSSDGECTPTGIYNGNWVWLSDLYHGTGNPIPIATTPQGKLTSLQAIAPAPMGTPPYAGGRLNEIHPWISAIDQVKMGDFEPSFLPGAGAGYGAGTFS